jgi:hypothetical protein
MDEAARLAVWLGPRDLALGCCRHARSDSRLKHSVAAAEMNDPKTNKVAATGSMATARSDQTTALLSDGRD